MTDRLFKPSFRARTAWTRFLLVVVVGLAADLGSKAWAFKGISLDRQRLVVDRAHDPTRPYRSTPFLFGTMDIKPVLNPGAVFGLGSHRRPFLIGFTLLALTAGVGMFGWRTDTGDRRGQIAIGCLLGGGLGNLTDRLMFGRVRDFLHMFPGRSLPGGRTWPGTMNTDLAPWVFNVADLLLLVGVILIARTIYLERRTARQA